MVSMLAIKASAVGQQQGLSPEVYPDVIASLKVLKHLMDLMNQFNKYSLGIMCL